MIMMVDLHETLSKIPHFSEIELNAYLDNLPPEEIRSLAEQVFRTKETLKQEQQILFYQPVSEEAKKIHLSTATEVLTVGGNRSSKTTAHLAELVIQMTGVVPLVLRDIYPKEKLRPPIRARITCQSLTNTWEPVIKPKLQYNKWNGRGDPGGEYGLWGLIPKSFLIHGKWEDSWSEKNRTLTLTNGSTMQVMSFDQDVENFSGSSLHLCLHDEGPPESIYRENKMRIIDVKGRIMTAMTPPDEESTGWEAAWIFDSVYEKGQSGPGKNPNIDSFTLFTEHNRILDQQAIADITAGLTENQKEVRLHGRFIHLSGRIYPAYTDRSQWWCFTCNKIALPLADSLWTLCATCKGNDTVEFKHFIEPFDDAYRWPVIYVLDPHPRKPHCMAWYAVSPDDDIYQIKEMEIDAAPEIVRNKVMEWEGDFDIHIVKRIIDPKTAGAAPGITGGIRGGTVRQDFDRVGLRCDLADSNRDTARSRLRSMLEPDFRTRTPRFFVFNNCARTNYMFLHYVWGEWSSRSYGTKNPKPVPMDINDDFVALAQYLANLQPSYSRISSMKSSFVKPGRRGAY